jgi:hypothetical protein
MGLREKERRKPERPLLTIAGILAWADEHHVRTGAWPNRKSGAIHGTYGEEKWQNVNACLRQGHRGLAGVASLARLLAEHRGYRNRKGLQPLAIEQILQWADAYHRRTGHWPQKRSGSIPEAPGETWYAVDAALTQGLRGLRADATLAGLLELQRGVRNKQNLPRLRVRHILGWADAYRARTGRWPTYKSGSIQEAPGETWMAVHMALYVGARGFPGGATLAQLLTRYRHSARGR